MGKAWFGCFSQSRALDLNRRGRIHWRTHLMDVQDPMLRTNISIVELLPPEIVGTLGAEVFGNVAERSMEKGDLDHFLQRKKGLTPFSSSCSIPFPDCHRYTFHTRERYFTSPLGVVKSKSKWLLLQTERCRLEKYTGNTHLFRLHHTLWLHESAISDKTNDS